MIADLGNVVAYRMIYRTTSPGEWMPYATVRSRIAAEHLAKVLNDEAKVFYDRTKWGFPQSEYAALPDFSWIASVRWWQEPEWFRFDFIGAE